MPAYTQAYKCDEYKKYEITKKQKHKKKFTKKIIEIN